MRNLIFPLVIGLVFAAGCQNKELLQCQQKQQTIEEENYKLKTSVGSLSNILKESVDKSQSLKTRIDQLTKTNKDIQEKRRKDREKMQKAILSFQGKIEQLNQELKKARELAASLEQKLSQARKYQSELAAANKKLKNAESQAAKLTEENRNLKAKIADLPKSASK